MVDIVTILVIIAFAALVWFAISATEAVQPAAQGSGTLTWKTIGES